MRRGLLLLLALAVVVGALGWWLTTPERIEAAELPAHTPDLANGERMFFAGGCGACHAAAGAQGDDMLVLVGGQALETPFGTFRVPNISPHLQSGIGGWSDVDFVNAMQRGVAPDGRHYYPAFPYGSYARMRTEDVLDLKAFMDTLPAVGSDAVEHDLPFPFNVRRGIGLWKKLFLGEEPVVEFTDPDPAVARGQYLVEGPGHCGECHTGRNYFGGMNTDGWLAGGANPEGKGTIPNITPHPDGIGDWSLGDIAYSLETGFKPDFDSFGGRMAPVQRNMARLPPEDREAIAAYLKAIPPLPDAVAATTE